MVKTLTAIALALAIGLAPSSAFAQARSGTRSASFLDMFPPDQMTCGRRGWRFPGLIRGDVPVTACILRFRNNEGASPFGRL